MKTKTEELVEKREDLTPPKWLPGKVKFEALMGSHAYGTSTEDSDKDMVGFCVPPPEYVFSHLNGELPGFGRQKTTFEHYDQTAEDSDWDVNIFSIVHFCHTCMDGNPTWQEALFAPENCILTQTDISDHLLENRKLFLHKGCFHRYTGYATSQVHKMKNEENEERAFKYGYHAVRLMLELEDIFNHRDLFLDRHSETLQEIRNGNWPKEKIEGLKTAKESLLKNKYEDENHSLPYRPDEEEIKNVLVDCLEMEYGNMKELNDVRS